MVETSAFFATKCMENLQMGDEMTPPGSNSKIEQMIEQEVEKISKLNINTTCVPELLMLVPCSISEHVPVSGGVGFFVIRGNRLIDISRGQLGEKAESLLSSTKGCGYENCKNTALESLKDDTNLPDMVCCSVKMPTHMVSLTDFCEEHNETSFPVLVVSNLLDVTCQFKNFSKKIMTKENYRIPFSLNENFCPELGKPKSPVFALSLCSVLRWANFINNKEEFEQDEFSYMPSKLRSILNDLHSLMLSRFPVANLQIDTELEFLNKVEEIMKKNEILRGSKRKIEEHFVNIVEAQKYKRYHGEMNWFTSKKILPDYYSNAGIDTGFTDMTLKCKAYDITLSQDKGYNAFQDVENIRTVATKTWDNTFNCLACEESHKVMHNDYGLNLVVSDQHFPAVIPCFRNSCVAVNRYSNLTLPNLYRHVLYPILKGGGNGATIDRNGATDLIQYCISRGISVTLMMCSGTSLTKDGPAGYTQAMQEIQFMIRALSDKNGNHLIKSVIFPAPLIPAIAPVLESDSFVIKYNKYKVEASNMARIACLRASEPKLQFISNTEFVQNSVTSEDTSPLREALDFSFLGGLKSQYNKFVIKEMKILKLPTNVTLPKESRSTKDGALKPAVLAEYSKCVHYDFNEVSKTNILLFISYYIIR